jgi:hypothetical protein
MAIRLEAPPAPAPRSGGRTSAEGLLPASLAATACLLVLPGTTVTLLLRVTGASVGTAGAWLVTALVSLGCMFAGSQVWARHPRSANLSFGELVLWSWARRRRAEGTLQRGESLFDDDLAELLDPRGRSEQVKVLRELNAALEVRDPYTRGHSRRVERHAHRIALALRCSDDDIFDVRLAASLHDVGKIKVPDRVLRKDGPLDESEWAVMKQHSEVGAALLERLGNRNVVASVRSHHERWDGRGYPDGIWGTQIPLGARIIAVADTFDAITSCRPYRSRAGRAHAISVLKEEAGAQFDPAVVSAFLTTTPHQAAVFAGAAALVVPVARKLASQWGVLFNKVGAVSLAGTMTASAFTGAAVEQTVKPREEHGAKVSPADPAVEGAEAGEPAADRPGGAPGPRGKALGHDKKAHAGGNGKSQAHRKDDHGGLPNGKAGGHGKTPPGKAKAQAEAPAGAAEKGKPAHAGKPADSGKPAGPGKPAESAPNDQTAPASDAAPEPAAPEPEAPASPPAAKPKPPKPSEPEVAAEAAPPQPAPAPQESPAQGDGKTK